MITCPELLAPAGGPDAGYAALHYGADAVYLGLAKFSARGEAENFCLAELETFVAFAHALTPRRSVYATVNTLIRDAELGEVAGILSDCVGAGVDAVIVQDMGVARMARSLFRGLALHASTQLATHNRDGVIAAKAAGFARVNLARELPLDEIQHCAAVPGIETEVFIHGALCYSYSGLCLYSSLLRGRSGNRGACAYPCRDRFRLHHQGKDEGKFAFSMKDLALPDQIAQLQKTGVASLKIEGRKKSPLYVATATALYRRILDGNASIEELSDLAEDVKTVFSRPWTTLFAKGRRNTETIDTGTVGHRGAPIGHVISLRKDPEGTHLQFRPTRPLEIRDGIQIDVPEQDKPFGFSLQKIYCIDAQGKPHSVCEVKAGTLIETILPAKAPQLSKGAPVYCASSQQTKQEYPFSRANPITHKLRFHMDARVYVMPQQILVSAIVLDRWGEPVLEDECTMEGTFSQAKDPGHTETAIRDAFAKLGDTPFCLGKLDIENPDGRFAPVSLLNKLRRNLVEDLSPKLTDYRQANRDKAIAAFTSRHRNRQQKPACETWTIAMDHPAALDACTQSDLSSVDEVIFRLRPDVCKDPAKALQHVATRVDLQKIRVGLPLIIREHDRAGTAAAIQAASDLGITRWEVNSSGGRVLLETILSGSLDITAGWSLYVRNREAVAYYANLGYSRMTASPEEDMESLPVLLQACGEHLTVPLWFDPPLMISESCASASLAGHCPRDGKCRQHQTRELRSATRNEQILLLQENCRSLILHHAPFSRLHHLQELRTAGARHFLLEFVYRDWEPAELARMWREHILLSR
jgi:U32 family peptidase